ncbi:MAG: hypothetical protein A4E46_00018 [Methanosaeta sp. PtaU1.Bin016]|nr:MAG: hypothetical protein A4E46_00018 [Methanosaeta sp. PtaU1.Bin016]
MTEGTSTLTPTSRGPYLAWMPYLSISRPTISAPTLPSARRVHFASIEVPSASRTPRHLPSSTIRSASLECSRNFTPLLARSSLKASMIWGVLSEPMWRCLMAVKRAPAAAARRRRASSSSGVGCCVSLGAPYLRKAESTSSTSSQALPAASFSRSPPMDG